MTTITNDLTVSSALDWLIAAQAATGELASVAGPLEVDEPVWTPDSLKFITALVALALDEIPDARAVDVVDRAVDFLVREQETMAQWRYWATSNDQYWFTPPDADDTACCSMAVATRGHPTGRNRAVLLANRDRSGRFYTWLIPHRSSVDPRVWWAMRDELRSTVRRHRAELWRTTEARPEDVDGVVNTNVIRYLGRRAPVQAAAWVASIIRDGREDDCDSWHRNRYTLYAAIADAHRRGVEAFSPLGPTIVERILDRIDDRGAVGPPLDTAFALIALCEFSAPESERERLADALRRTQLDDGPWERSVFYYGGPKEVFGWASEALTTATAVQALTRHRHLGPGRPPGTSDA